VAERRRLSPALRRDQLIAAALDVAAGRDFSAVSVQDIAQRAGVSEGLLYHYFPAKDALLIAAARSAADTMIRALDAALTGPPREALLAGLTAYLDHVQAQPTGWRALLGAHTGELGDVAAGVEAHSRRLLLTALAVTRPSPTLTAVLDGWTAFERAACLSWLNEPGMQRAALEDLLLSSFLGALEAAARHEPQIQALLGVLIAA